jgi:hypothetical protein
LPSGWFELRRDERGRRDNSKLRLERIVAAEDEEGNSMRKQLIAEMSERRANDEEAATLDFSLMPWVWARGRQAWAFQYLRETSAIETIAH